jgi:GxxExxY protein
MYLKLSEREEYLGSEIVDAAFNVHRKMGPGLLEKIYEACFCYELDKRGIPYVQQAKLPVMYDGHLLDKGLVMDIFVDDLVICELKSVEVVNPVFAAQLISYLKLSNSRLGYLINFNVPLIRDGIKRFVI